MTRTRWVEPWYLVYGLVGMLAAGVLPMLLPQYINETGDTAHVGLVMAVLNIGGLTAPLWGYLADKRLHKVLILIALAVLGLSAFLIASSVSLSQWMIFAFLLGAAITAVNTVAGLLIVERHPRAEWDQRMGWLLTTFGGGQVVGLLVAGFLSGAKSAAGLTMTAVIALVAGLLAFFLLPASPLAQRDHPQHLKALAMHIPHIPASPASVFHHLGHTRPDAMLKVIRTPFGVFLMGFGLLALASSLIFTPYPLLFQNLYNIQPSVAAVIFSVGATIAIFWYPAAGAVGKRIGEQRLFKRALLVRCLSFLVLTVLVMMPSLFKSLLAALSFAVIVNTWPFLSVSATVLVASLAAIPEGEAMGIYNAFAAIMGTIGALLSGLLSAQFGYEVLPLGAAVVGLVALTVIFGARSTLRNAELRRSDHDG